MMLTSLGWALELAALLGVCALALQWLAVITRPRDRSSMEAPALGITLLKPLCGLDDGLEENLEAFARLPAPGPLEILLGVKEVADPAYQLARQMVARHPARFRLLVQQGRPGLNPKVNQLITLARAARHELLVISDANVQVPASYLFDIARHLSRPQVGCVTHPPVGVGERTLGAWLDNLQVTASAAAGMVAAKRVANRPLAIGKSLALRRRELEALGGFEAMKDVLAEDHLMGCWIQHRLGLEVVVSALSVFNVSRDHSLRSFWERHARWAVTNRTAVSLPTSLGQALLNPVPLAALGALLAGARLAVGVSAGVFALKSLLDTMVVRHFRPASFAKILGTLWLKDALVFACWARALVVRSVSWRGNALAVAHGSRLTTLGVR